MNSPPALRASLRARCLLIVGAPVALSVAACGGMVVIDGESSGGGGGAGGASVSTSVSNGTTATATSTSATTSSVSSGSGRPFLVDGALRAASAAPAAAPWGSGRDIALPQIDGLSPAVREALAAAWVRDALLEHASVASFARFSLELLAHGAPAELVESAHRAALDEAEHAELCFALASAYGGAPVGPSKLELGPSLALAGSLAELAASAAREGCAGETLSALVAAEQLAGTRDPAVRAVLARITEDESRHAELAWATVRWAMETGGEPVRAAVVAAFAAAAGELPDVEEGEADDDLSGALAAHGRLGSEELRAAHMAGLSEVVLPCAAALLDTTPGA